MVPHPKRGKPEELRRRNEIIDREETEYAIVTHKAIEKTEREENR
jgi:hypothetical protein